MLNATMETQSNAEIEVTSEAYGTAFSRQSNLDRFTRVHMSLNDQNKLYRSVTHRSTFAYLANINMVRAVISSGVFTRCYIATLISFQSSKASLGTGQ